MKIITLILFPIILSSCATRQDAYTGDAASLSVNECLRPNRINGFTSIDKLHVVLLERPGNRDWLVTTKGGCHELDTATSISVSARATSCIRRFDQLIAPEAGNSRVDRCIIDSLEVVENVEIARTLIQSRMTTDENESEDEGSELMPLN